MMKEEYSLPFPSCFSVNFLETSQSLYRSWKTWKMGCLWQTQKSLGIISEIILSQVFESDFFNITEQIDKLMHAILYFISIFLFFYHFLPCCYIIDFFQDTLLSFPAPCISESCIKVKINLNFYFQTSLWCL